MSELFDCADPAQRARGIAAAVSATKLGRLVVLPTDTVYGVGADAFDSAAVAALLAAKGRGRDMPVGVLVGSWHTIEGLVFAMPDGARELIRAFWPGALSLVVRQAPSLQWDLGDARGTVMLRMPLHPVAIELLREVNLGAESAVFIDDSAIERARISSAVPGVLTPEWPEDPTRYREALAALRCFDTPSLTVEDRARGRMYAEERARKETMAAAGDLDTWLTSLGITVSVEPLTAANWMARTFSSMSSRPTMPASGNSAVSC